MFPIPERGCDVIKPGDHPNVFCFGVVRRILVPQPFITGIGIVGCDEKRCVIKGPGHHRSATSVESFSIS